MRTLAMVLGVLGLGALVVLAVAGMAGARAVLITGAAGLAMIVLGSLLGGRRTPDRAPYQPSAHETTPAPPAAGTAPDAAPEGAAGPGTEARSGGEAAEASP